VDDEEHWHDREGSAGAFHVCRGELDEVRLELLDHVL
jgi:hypothetical protein